MSNVAEKPWETEPNRLEWEHAGLRCLILRATTGHLCGYVGLPQGHPLYGVGKNEPCDALGGKTIREALDVHGGITWADEGDGMEWPKGYWWVGFDCAHAGDLVPASPLPWEVYRDINWVKAETERLAEQLAAI